MRIVKKIDDWSDLAAGFVFYILPIGVMIVIVSQMEDVEAKIFAIPLLSIIPIFTKTRREYSFMLMIMGVCLSLVSYIGAIILFLGIVLLFLSQKEENQTNKTPCK